MLSSILYLSKLVGLPINEKIGGPFSPQGRVFFFLVGMSPEPRIAFVHCGWVSHVEANPSLVMNSVSSKKVTPRRNINN